MFTPHPVSNVWYLGHMSYVTCHVSCVRFLSSDKFIELVSRGLGEVNNLLKCTFWDIHWIQIRNNLKPLLNQNLFNSIIKVRVHTLSFFNFNKSTALKSTQHTELHCTINCTEQYTAYWTVLYIAHYSALHTELYYNLHRTVHCILNRTVVYIAQNSALHTKMHCTVHCTEQCTAYWSALYYTLHRTVHCTLNSELPKRNAGSAIFITYWKLLQLFLLHATKK